MERLCRRLGFKKFFFVEPKGIVGGLCFMWKDEIKVTILGDPRNWIDREIDVGDGKVWRFTGVHASTDYRERRSMWSAISNFVVSPSVPWVMLGDFNSILSNEEKFGGVDREDWEMRDFSNFIGNNWLIDIGYVGYPYTWNNKRGGRANIRLRLDRALVNSLWRSDYPNGFLQHLISSQGGRTIAQFSTKFSCRNCPL